MLGLATAYALVELGMRDVVMLERAIPGAGASGRSGALLRSNYDNPVEARLAEHSLAVYRDFARQVGANCDFRAVGLIVAARHEQAASLTRLAAEQQGWGVGIVAIDPAAAQGLVPGLRTDDVGLFLHQPDAGCCDANAVVIAYYRRLIDAGVDIRLCCPALAPICRGGRVRGFETADGPVEGDAVVIAAGIWTNRLLPTDLDLGLVPHLTRVASFRPFEFSQDDVPTIIDIVQDSWFRPLGGGTILVGSESGVLANVDPDAVPSTAPNDLVEHYRHILASRFAVSPWAAPRGAWAGAFMVSPDQRPVVGPVPGMEGLYILSGDSGGAFKTAPALGLALAETILCGTAISIDIAGLAPGRLLPHMRQPGIRGATVSR